MSRMTRRSYVVVLALALALGPLSSVARLDADTLTTNEYLEADDALYSDNGFYRLLVHVIPYGQPSNDWLVLSLQEWWGGSWHTTWSAFNDDESGNPPGTHSPQWCDVDPDGYLLVQSDGNVVLSDGVPCWATNTHNYSGSYLSMQNDGNLVVYTPLGTPIWALW